MLDFGSQYSHLIVRRIRECGVYAEALPHNTVAARLATIPGLKGIVLSGSPASVRQQAPPAFDSAVLELGLPVLGICYGHQLLAHLSGGSVERSKMGEYGRTALRLTRACALFRGCPRKLTVWMSHKDVVTRAGRGFNAVAVTVASRFAAVENAAKKQFGVQFHPEVAHTEHGATILRNFVLSICHCRRQWKPSTFVAHAIAEARARIGKRRAIIALSGGIDSMTAATLVARAIGRRLTAVYVDNGLMRAGETEFVRRALARAGLRLKIVRCPNRFFRALRGIRAPERKRKVIGRLFIKIFKECAAKIGAQVLVQGTIYPDRIESGLTRRSSRIKSHHNVGGLPASPGLELYEPLRELYKDEVKAVARTVGIPREIIERHVFPGPGLAVRVLGEVTPEKVEIVRRASTIVEEELRKAGLYIRQWMGFAVLLPVKSVGVQGDARTYGHVVAVRAVESRDAMTANFSKLPSSLLDRISTRITNEIPKVNRVVYDITNKPPATMEWE